MRSRRSMVGWSLGLVAALGGGAAWFKAERDGTAFARMAGKIWRGPDAAASPVPRELARCATLAPNSHNTQPWRFIAENEGLRVLPDFTRRTPVVDPDDHHLFTSLGCAVENMVQAAPTLGRRAEVEVMPDGSALLRLLPQPPHDSALAAAIAQRRSIRAAFDPSPLPTGELALLAEAGGADSRVGLVLVSDPARRASLTELILAGNSVQLRDQAFLDELTDWIRFSHRAALERRDGLFAGSSGNPVMPSPLGRVLFRQVFTVASETDRMARLLAGSAGFAVFAAEREDPAHWLAAGRAAQRFCLMATALGLRTSWVNQPVEVPALRPVLAAWLDLGGRRPDLVLRFGRGPSLPPSLRRPVEEVFVEAAA